MTLENHQPSSKDKVTWKDIYDVVETNNKKLDDLSRHLYIKMDKLREDVVNLKVKVAVISASITTALFALFKFLESSPK